MPSQTFLEHNDLLQLKRAVTAQASAVERHYGPSPAIDRLRTRLSRAVNLAIRASAGLPPTEVPPLITVLTPFAALMLQEEIQDAVQECLAWQRRN